MKQSIVLNDHAIMLVSPRRILVLGSPSEELLETHLEISLPASDQLASLVDEYCFLVSDLRVMLADQWGFQLWEINKKLQAVLVTQGKVPDNCETLMSLQYNKKSHVVIGTTRSSCILWNVKGLKKFLGNFLMLFKVKVRHQLSFQWKKVL